MKKKKHWIKHVHSICIAGLAPDKIIHKAQNKVKAWDASKVSKKDNFYSEGFYHLRDPSFHCHVFKFCYGESHKWPHTRNDHDKGQPSLYG